MIRPPEHRVRVLTSLTTTTGIYSRDYTPNMGVFAFLGIPWVHPSVGASQINAWFSHQHQENHIFSLGPAPRYDPGHHISFYIADTNDITSGICFLSVVQSFNMLLTRSFYWKYHLLKPTWRYTLVPCIFNVFCGSSDDLGRYRLVKTSHVTWWLNSCPKPYGYSVLFA